jgi:YD repeat-containing protein
MEVYFSMDDLTRKFDVVSNDADSRTILRQVYESLRLKGYNPINQIVGYILSEDTTYITNYNNARSLICKLDRDELLREMVVHYLNQ